VWQLNSDFDCLTKNEQIDCHAVNQCGHSLNRLGIVARLVSDDPSRRVGSRHSFFLRKALARHRGVWDADVHLLPVRMIGAAKEISPGSPAINCPKSCDSELARLCQSTQLLLQVAEPRKIVTPTSTCTPLYISLKYFCATHDQTRPPKRPAIPSRRPDSRGLFRRIFGRVPST
jgi:hypothetical protein